MLKAFVAELLAQFGIKGVSTVALVLLVSVALYAHKASKVGRTAVTLGSTAAHDAKVVAVVLAALLVLGIFTADVERSREILRIIGQRFKPGEWLDQLLIWVS